MNLLSNIISTVILVPTIFLCCSCAESDSHQHNLNAVEYADSASALSAILDKKSSGERFDSARNYLFSQVETGSISDIELQEWYEIETKAMLSRDDQGSYKLYFDLPYFIDLFEEHKLSILAEYPSEENDNNRKIIYSTSSGLGGYITLQNEDVQDDLIQFHIDRGDSVKFIFTVIISGLGYDDLTLYKEIYLPSAIGDMESREE